MRKLNRLKLYRILPLMAAILMLGIAPGQADDMCDNCPYYGQKKMGMRPGSGMPGFHSMHPGMGRNMHPEGGFFFGNADRMKKELNLSDEQITKTSAVNETYKERFHNLVDKTKPLHDKLREEMRKDNVNQAEVKKTLEALSAVQVDMQMERINHRLEIEKILTAEQKQTMRKKHEERMKMMQGQDQEE